jgi:hypothetical protein
MFLKIVLNSQLDDVLILLEMGIGDVGRLEHIKLTLENEKEVYISDKQYLKKLVNQHLKNENEKSSKTKQVEELSETASNTKSDSKQESELTSKHDAEFVEDEKKLGFCGNCGNELKTENNFCSKCGSSIHNPKNSTRGSDKFNPTGNHPQMIEWKSLSIATILAVIIGLIGIQGVGHFYVGKIAKGFGILISPLFMIFLVFMASTGISTLQYATGDRETMAIVFIIIIIGGIVGFIAMFIWQICDARKLCREYNDYLEKNGTAPW